MIRKIITARVEKLTEIKQADLDDKIKEKFDEMLETKKDKEDKDEEKE